MPRKKDCKEPVKKNGNGRVTNKTRVAKAWAASVQKWPPSLGDKVRLLVPKDLRGISVKVIAVGTEKTKNSTRMAPNGKIRVLYGNARNGGEDRQFAVSQQDVFPNEFSLKSFQALS